MHCHDNHSPVFDVKRYLMNIEMDRLLNIGMIKNFLQI